jgi:hypothetical protein
MTMRAKQGFFELLWLRTSVRTLRRGGLHDT